MIRHCINDDKSTCYTLAMKLLEQHYGDPHRIASAYLKELGQWPKLSANNSAEFRSFNRFLIKCKIYKNKDNFLTELDSAETLRTLVLKLPLHLQDKWGRKADDIRSKRNKIPSFLDFCEFIDVESRIINDPLFSREALHGASKPVDNKTPAMASMATGMEVQPTSQACHMCGTANHDLDDCEEYKKLARSAKVKFLYEKKLCYACYGNKTNNHVGATCTQKRTCSVCQEDHPTGLHRYEVIPARSTVASQPDGNEEVVSMCVLPIRLTHKDRPGKEVVVYAVLDDCSKGVFVLESALEGLDIPGIRCKSLDAKINTMIGSAMGQTTRVEGLVVRCSAEHENNYPTSAPVNLPAAYTREMIPIDENEMPTPERVQRWKYLDSILKHLPEYDPSIPFALLIGANCPRALEPHQVINCQETGPYAVRTQLGWCVIGTLGRSEKAIGTAGLRISSRLTTLDASTNQVSKHHFASERNIDETISIKQMLSKMYDSEFTEAYNDKTSLSQEDRKFMDLMESNCQVIKGRYQLPLPFRDNNVVMPFNKAMAVQRSNSLRHRLKKNPKFYTDYVAFMNNLMIKGYAQECEIESSGSEWNGWFIPHHGVYHPNKPDKIRVVFDCAAEYKGVALNKMLLQGPNLANMQLGVFLRFRKEEVPFMADIESMFYQVLIPPEQRRYVRFLWWPEGNLSSELREYEMCVHLFGAISSPGVANFALRRCAIDSRDECGEAAYSTLMKNFYVDHMLKSVDTEDEAASLAVSINKSCEGRGFNLTKFISPSMKLLQS